MVITQVYAMTIPSILNWLGHTLILTRRGELNAGTHFIPRAYATGNYCGLEWLEYSVLQWRLSFLKLKKFCRYFLKGH